MAASLIALVALIGGWLAARSPDGMSWLKFGVASVACAVALTFAYLRSRAAVHNRG